MLGADVTYVGSSVFFLENRGPAAAEIRERVRLGVQCQGENDRAAFYGLTRLDEEFEGQSGSQIVESARFNFRF